VGVRDQEVPGWGDFRVWLGPADVGFAAETGGWRVVIDGEFPEDLSDDLVKTVAKQIQNAIGIQTARVRVD
jgi:hypothetical protein